MSSVKDYFGSDVNFDYIVAIVVKENGLLEKVHFPITEYDGLKESLIRSLDDPDDTVLDMYRTYNRYIYENRAFDICIGHSSYNGAYIEPLRKPAFDVNEMREWINKKEKRIMALRFYVNKKNLREISEQDIIRIAEERRAKELEVFHYGLKRKFIESCASYINACAYSETYDQIKDKVVFISSERHGWKKEKSSKAPSWEYTINDDLKISLWSNFCYGQSSKFILQVYYKEIRLCPYTEFVTYRYANAADILAYTRTFSLEKRKSWDSAADFVTSFCNGAVKDPHEFVKNEILYEINTLVDELTKIAESKEAYLENAFNISEYDTRRRNLSRYSNVRNVRDFDEMELKCYRDNPVEYELLFRMEKISGGLKFLESIGQFSDISDNVEAAIQRIKRLNVMIYPELSEVTVPIAKEVEELLDIMNEQISIRDSLEKRVEVHRKRIEYLKKKNAKKEGYVAEDVYREHNPEFVQLESDLKNAQQRVSQRANLYKSRQTFLEKLLDCKFCIETSGVLNDCADEGNGVSPR